MADAPNTDQRFLYFSSDRGVFRVPDSPDNAEDLYLFYTTPDRFKPITQFEYDKEQRKAELRQQGAEAYTKAFFKGVASDLSFGGTEAYSAIDDPVNYFAYREEFPGTMMAGEITSAVGTSIPAVAAATALGPAGTAAAAGTQFVSEAAQIAARREAREAVLKRLIGGSALTSATSEILQQKIKSKIQQKLAGRISARGVKVAEGAAGLGALAGEVAVDAGIRGMVRGASEQQALDPDSDFADLWAAGVDTAVSDITGGLQFAGLAVGGVGALKGGLELGRAARASKFYQEGVSPMVANIKAAIFSRPEFREDTAQLIDALQRGDSEQLDLMARGNEIAADRATLQSEISNLRDRLSLNTTQRQLARLDAQGAAGTREGALAEAEAARAPFEEDIQSARAELDEAIVQRDDQALEVERLRRQRGEAAEPLKAERETLRGEKDQLKKAKADLKSAEKDAAQILDPRIPQLQQDIAAINKTIAGIKKELPEDIAKEKRNLAQDIQIRQSEIEKLEVDLEKVDLKDEEISRKQSELEQKKDDIAAKKADLKILDAKEKGQSSKDTSNQIISRRVAEVDNAIANNAPTEEIQSMMAELERINSALKIAENTLADQVLNVAYRNSQNQSGALLAISSGKTAVRDQAREFENTFSGEIRQSLDDTHEVLSSNEFKELTGAPLVTYSGGGNLTGDRSLAVQSQIQAFEQLPNLAETKELALSSMEYMEASLRTHSIFKEAADKVKFAHGLMKAAKTPEEFMVAYSFILDTRKDLGQFYGRKKGSIRKNSAESNTLNDMYNDVMNRQFLRNEEMFGDVATIQGISDSFNQVAVDSSMLAGGAYKKETSTQLFDRVTSVNDEINLAVNSMVQVSDDLAALAPGATSPAATFASELSSTVDPLIRSLEEVQGKYLDATGALNDLNSALKQLIDPNSRFELQTLEELAKREDMNLFGLSEVLTTLRNNYDAFQAAKTEKGEIATDIAFWRNQVKDLTAQKRSTGKDLSAAERELKKSRKDAAKSDAASAAVVTASSSNASAARAAIASLEAGKIIDARNLQKLNSERAALRRSATDELNRAEKTILGEIKSRRGQSQSTINSLRETALKEINQQEHLREGLQQQLRELLSEPGATTGKQSEAIKLIQDKITNSEKTIARLEGALSKANKALQAAEDLKKSRKGDVKGARAKVRDLEKKADEAAEEAARDYFDGLRESVKEPLKRLADAEAARVTLVRDLEKAQSELVGLATPDASALERLTRAKRELGPPTLIGEAFTRRGLASMGLTYAAGPMVGGAAFGYMRTRANPLGAFELQQRITSAGQTIATKIDNTLNRLLSNQPLNPTKANQTYMLGRSSFAKMLKSYLVLQDSPAYVLTQEQAQDQREALRKLFNSPKQLTNLLERSGNSAPEEYAEAATKTTERVLSLANQIYPEEPPKPIFDKRPSDFTREELVTISNFNKMAQDPLNYVLYKLESNTLTAEDVNTLKALSPQIASKVMTQIISTIQESDKAIPFGTQVALSTAFGLDLEAMENVAQLQNLLAAQASPTDQGQGTLNPEGVNRLRGTAQANMTQTQAVEAVGIG